MPYRGRLRWPVFASLLVLVGALLLAAPLAGSVCARKTGRPVRA